MGQPDRIIGTRVFGDYDITRKIGEGGMGAVYLAENRALGETCALKVLLPERLASRNAVARFIAEARAADAIEHENIIKIQATGTLPDGRYCILMEYLDGKTLRDYARPLVPMAVEQVLPIMTQVCAGLQAAHDRGIVHRDLKPSNIFLVPQPGGRLLVKILDFGIAKLEDPELAGDVRTKSHTVAGTPNYMSPEQARALHDADHRADVYSIGAITYELLTGRLPYKASSIGDLSYQQATTTPPVPAALRRELPLDWSELVMDAIALEPPRRVASAAELAERMRRASSEPPPEALDTYDRLPPVREQTVSMAGLPPEEPASLGAIGDPIPGEEATRAATPMALSRNRLPRLPEPDRNISSPTWPTPSPLSPLSPPPSQRSRPPSGPPPSGPPPSGPPRPGQVGPVPAAPPPGPPGRGPEVPTTLGMSASQIDIGHTVLTSRRSWGWVGVVAMLALFGLAALVIVVTRNHSAARPAPPPIDAAGAAADAGPASVPVPTVKPLRPDADAGAER